MGNSLPIPFPRRNPLAAERAFLPAALEIVETPPSPTLRITALAICAVFAVALLWATFGFVDIVAVAPGKIIASGRTKVVQPMEIGVVRSIKVDEGERVTAGQVLIELDPTTSKAELEHAAKDMGSARLDIARLEALLGNKDGDPFAGIDGADPVELAQERVEFLSQRAEQQAKLASIARSLAEKEAEAAGVRASLAKIQAELPLATQRSDIRRQSAESGYGSQLTYIEAEEQRLDLETEKPIEQHKLEEAEAGIEAAKRYKDQTEAEYTKVLSNDLSKAQEQESTAREALAKATQRTRLQELRAPVDGIVQGLTVHTLGAVVTPAEQLLSVVPTKDAVQVEAIVENRDIGFVHAGQLAEIKVETFPFTRYGLLHGTVTDVATDATINENAPRQNDTTRRAADQPTEEERAHALVYTARVALAKTQMEIDGKPVDMLPGMAVTVEIKTGRRRVISYLLSPLGDYAHGAMHER